MVTDSGLDKATTCLPGGRGGKCEDSRKPGSLKLVLQNEAKIRELMESLNKEQV